MNIDTDRNRIFIHGQDETVFNHYLVIEMDDINGAKLSTARNTLYGSLYPGFNEIITNVSSLKFGDLTLDSGRELNLLSGISSDINIIAGNNLISSTVPSGNTNISAGNSSNPLISGGYVDIQSGRNNGTSNTRILLSGGSAKHLEIYVCILIIPVYCSLIIVIM